MLLPLLLAAAVQAAAPVPPLGLNRADANRDGVITRAEASANADRRFARFDADRDGTVTPDERRAVRRALRERPITAAEWQQRSQARFVLMDANHDGMLSGDERRGGRGFGRHRGPGPHGGPHGGPDADGPDGGPDGLPPQPGALDDGPKGMSITAAQFRTRALQRFDRADANHDGRLDTAEMAGRRAMRRRG